MNDATKAMRDFLTKSPSVVFPDEVMEMFIPVEKENERLCELIKKVWKWEKNGCCECPLEKDCKVLCVYDGDCGIAVEIEKKLQELGIEADDDD